jgi:hypothetical protein
MDRTFAMYLEKVHTEELLASNNSKEKNILQDKCNLLEAQKNVGEFSCACPKWSAIIRG